MTKLPYTRAVLKNYRGYYSHLVFFLKFFEGLLKFENYKYTPLSSAVVVRLLRTQGKEGKMKSCREPISIKCWLQVIFFVILRCVATSDSQPLSLPYSTSIAKHAEGYCSMYGICGKRSDGKVLNCPYNTPSVKPDELLSLKIQSLCPAIHGNVCCTADQFETLRREVQQAVVLLAGCPACLRNFLNFFCEFACSPNQSLISNVTSVAKDVSNATIVDSVDYYVSDTFGEELYNSCKDVKFGSVNTRAMDFVGAGAKNFKELFAFWGRRSVLGGLGSPYAINFPSNIPKSSGIFPLNISAYSCGDSSLGCSCGDCPSLACSSSESPAQHEGGQCNIKIQSLKLKCIELAVAVTYMLLVAVFLFWVLLYRIRRKVKYASKMEPFSNRNNTEETNGVMKQGNDHISMQVAKDDFTVVKSAHISLLQCHIASFYRKYGEWIARFPIFTLCSSLGFVFLLCLGLLRFEVETQPVKLWVAHGSRALKDKEYFDKHLGPFYRIEQLIIASTPTLHPDNVHSIVTDDNIKLLFEIQKKIDGIRANYSGSMVSLLDICVKPLSEDCASQSVLQYFGMNPDNFDSHGGVNHAQYCFEHYTSVECLGAFHGPVDPNTVLGGFSGSNFSEASAFLMTYPVKNGKNDLENGKAVAWEKAFVKLLKEEITALVQSRNLTVSFSSEISVEEELKRESTADAITILISYVVMFAYISLTLGNSPHLSTFYISSKVLLGLSGVVVVILSVLGSVGFFSAIGVKSTLIILEVIPFLVLAVGVDNMCILVHTVKRQPLDMPLGERIGNALVEVGPSITLASLSEVLAFAAGSFTPMPACRVFSMFAALSVLLNFLLQVTAFVALLIFDFRRTEDNRIDCFPCFQCNPDSTKDAHHSGPGVLARYMKEIHAPFLGHFVVKIVIIAVFAAFVFTSIALCTRIQPGLDQSIVLPRDSYLQGYFHNVSEYLRVGPPLYFVIKNYNYSLESNQTNQLCSINQCDSNSLLNEIARESLVPEMSYIAKPAASWLDDFLVWISPEAFGCCRKFTNGSQCPPSDQPPCCPSQQSCGIRDVCKDCTTCFRSSDLQKGRPSTMQFKEKIPWFLNALPSASCAKGGHGAYSSSVDLNDYESGIIKASEFRTYHTPLNKQADFVNAMRAARKFCSRVSHSLKMDIFPYSVFYIFFEQYLHIWKTALINISISLGAVFIVCLIMTSSFWSSLIILLVSSMIIVDMLGVMAILKIQLNAISVVNLVMSVGIAVEFCVHITHAFSISVGDREQRAKKALTTMGASVFSGITLTKLVGVIVLRFAQSEVFVVYYFQMYLALVLIGFMHGLVFLPVLLSLWGPPSYFKPLETKEDQPQTLSE